MARLRVIILYFMAAFILPPSVFAQAKKSLIVVNPSGFDRTDELVIIPRALAEKKLGRSIQFLKIERNGKAIRVQHDDLDGDRRWDEVVFIHNFKKNERAEFSITETADPGSGDTAQRRAYVRLRKKNNDDSFGPPLLKEEMPARNQPTDFGVQPLPMYLTEGPAWENDKAAFRLYFDIRNGKDIFGKRIPAMITDSVGLNPKDDYHKLSHWGMDVLHAGKSLGAGALALMVPGKNGKDSLIRVGGNNMKKTTYEMIAAGPLRAMFRLTYDWEIDGRPLSITDVTSIWGGQYFYESRLSVKGAPENTRLITGIADFDNNIFQVYRYSGAHIFFSHGRQSENHDYLGMAIMVPALFDYAGSAPLTDSDILNTYIVAQKIDPGKENVFRFYAGWEVTDKQFANAGYFRSMLNADADKLAAPLVVN